MPGSIAAPGPETVRYGGNTSCVEVQGDDGHVIVLDAGTGARPLGEALMRSSASRIDILLTHLHVDHVEGLGLFAPIWASKTELHIWGTAVARGEPGRTTRHLLLAAAVPRCTCQRCPLGCRSTMRRGALDDRIGAAHVSPDPASRAHRGLPVGARRAHARLRHRPRARAGHRSARGGHRVDLGVRSRSPRRPARARLPVHRRGVPRSRRMGPRERQPRRRVRPAGRGRPAGVVPPPPRSRRRRARCDARVDARRVAGGGRSCIVAAEGADVEV